MPEVHVLRRYGDYLHAGAQYCIGVKKIGYDPSGFFVGPKSAFRRKQSTFYPLTVDGWAEAWAEYARVDPLGAGEYAAQLLLTQQQRQQEADSRDRKVRLDAIPRFAVIDNCVLEGGYGFYPMSVGQRAELIFCEDSILIADSSSAVTLNEIKYPELIALRVEGPGAVTTGGDFIGGGIGVSGALEGMAVAAVLNAITTKTKIRTIIEIHDRKRDQIWSNNTITPQSCNELLIPVRAKIRDSESVPSSSGSSGGSPVDRMNNLTTLHQNGLITDEEFVTARQRILDSI